MPTPVPRPAKPTKEIFDPFNSSATGHQRAENRLSGSTSWRDSRNLKTNNQYRSGAGGGGRVSDTVGAGSLAFGVDGRTANGGWQRGAKGLRKNGQQSILESMPVSKVDDENERSAKKLKTQGKETEPTKVTSPFTPFTRDDGKIRETSWTSHESSPSHLLSPLDANATELTSPPPTAQNHQGESHHDHSPAQIFANLTFYINGSTAPLVSDHKLKRILSEHGGSLSIALGRRTVTHVITGRPSSSGGSGGGLSGSKLQKEVARKGGCAVKYVTADWVLESIKAGKRLPESRFEAVKMAPKGVNSIAGMFCRRESSAEPSKTKDGG